MRLFRHEYDADGLLSKYEARLMANRHSQQFGDLNYFLGNYVRCDSTGMFLSQNKYALELLDKAPVATCNSTRTPVDMESKLGSDGDLVSDPIIS
ncbi:ribonuclease H-like domain-containing protein [Tanacetum coccineum]